MNEAQRTVRLELSRDAKAVLSLPRLRVRVIEGPDSGLKADLGATLVVGRDRACDLALADGSVSSRHCRLEAQPTGVLVHDLGSTNRTLVNGVAVGQAHLKPGDRLQVGATVLQLELSDEPTLVLPEQEGRLGAMVGSSQRMRLLFGIVRQVARTLLNVLVQGETGTGKELVARTLHDLSPRHQAPFVVVDSTCLQASMAASELFGHAKGAFTGADRSHRGAFERAHGGTLFIDEVGELPLDVQASFLRALESGTFTPVGAEQPITVNVRVVAATNRDLQAMAAQGSFRRDLFYRLGEMTLALPALRERPDDLPPLVRELERQLLPRSRPDGRPVRFSDEALARLAAHPWPGNVRELRNYVARSMALARGDVIAPADLLPWDQAPTAAPTPTAAAPAASSEKLRDVELAMMREALARHGGNKSRAARDLGIPVSTLRDRIKRLGLDA